MKMAIDFFMIYKDHKSVKKTIDWFMAIAIAGCSLFVIGLFYLSIF